MDQKTRKFKNLSVFRFDFEKSMDDDTYLLTVNEIYDGENKTENGSRFYNKFIFIPKVAEQFFPRLKQMTFYTVRHGKGEHNVIKGWRKFVSPTLDPLLVEDDCHIRQCWYAISHDIIIRLQQQSELQWYSSPLRRAIQTCARLMYYCYINNPVNKYTITILPYLIELPKAVKTGLCDDAFVNRTLNSLGNFENKSTCLSDISRCKSIGQIFKQQNRHGSRLLSKTDKQHQQGLRKKTLQENINIFIDWTLINEKPYPSKLFTYYLVKRWITP